jgi:prefoldin subunit 5
MSNRKPSKKGGSMAHDASSTRIRTADTYNEQLEALETRMERLEALEMRMQQLEALKCKVDTMDQTLEFLSKELLRYQTLVQDISKMLGKFVAAM